MTTPDIQQLERAKSALDEAFQQLSYALDALEEFDSLRTIVGHCYGETGSAIGAVISTLMGLPFQASREAAKALANLPKEST